MNDVLRADPAGATRSAHDWATYFRRVRAASEALCAPLLVEDYGLQTADFASPPKWHLAHVSWFFETFLLEPFLPGYREFHPQFRVLFNSYYDQVGRYHPRPQRGFLSRPSVEEVYRYRAHVDAAMLELIDGAAPDVWPTVAQRLGIGLNHEQQHQELLLTDLKQHFSVNPLRPAYRTDLPEPARRSAAALGWIEREGGLVHIGQGGDGFAYDNELPRHRVFLTPFALATRPVTNGEYLAFIEDGGYRNPALWLSDGWSTVNRERWAHPRYWERHDGQWLEFTLGGLRPLDADAPVSHVSHFEADAYATWADARLPTEAEWEQVAAGVAVDGNFVETGLLHPQAMAGEGPLQLFGDVWEHTGSAYLAYPGYRQAEGALGEYNGKFMSGQMVLRGGSCATPADHIRASYRNFFYPQERWQFQGFRLARDL
ncbi:ergothioneine biosynthesis protein EgtB [Nitrogeniibacter mangrovi]|uniref:Ergothioneine biosynthesis protein EgtB n=1 Tax=Nitrogeniibacter mangrovi TaxID=2016596 RepID=A0A6C1B5F3_9RHOO|nr:ergothioneine biosynthesis protein EgtB [Nitrogeniibacter mangrovi]QID18673.1 ergothioneine biosynthesis protein EgtB [Nitrogeniibacter mangrovi]